MTGYALTTASGDQNTDAIVGLTLWDGGPVTYNFPITSAYYPAGYEDDHPFSSDWDIPGTFQPATAMVQATVTAVLESQFQAVSNLTFQQVGPNDVTDTSVAFVEFGNNFGGAGFWPFVNQIDGDFWFNAQYIDNVFTSFGLGSNPWATVIHEIGHSVGLAHGHTAEGIGGQAMTADRDSLEFSIMTYRAYIGAPAQGGDVGWNDWPQSLMIYDIAALQHMYGANYAWNSGDTQYVWDPATGEMFINSIGQGAPAENRIFLTIWDGGGADTYDLSNYSSDLNIDLTPGGWSNFNSGQLAELSMSNNIFARANVFNSLLYQDNPASLIENVIGGNGNDTILGNQANNVLEGGNGADILDGGDGDDSILATHTDGNDTLTGGNGFDILDYTGVNGVVQINQLAGTTTGSAGNDILLDVFERVNGTIYDDVLSGGHGINILDGNDGNDLFFGNNGDDLLRGQNGDDTFFFSTSDGDDRLEGGNGFDILDYSSLPGVVQVNQLAGTTTGTADNDTLLDVFEQVIGTNFDDVLSGGHGINSLNGGGGDDQLFANNGDDWTTGGTGSDTVTLGPGDDRFQFWDGDGADTVTDFIAGAGTDDQLVLSTVSEATSLAQLLDDGMITQDGPDTIINFGGGDMITLLDVTAIDLHSNDFIF